ncbi:hypothetical protein [Bradyrhizobium canariense]|jgi:hypothetical protein|uniref:hypothetical protein n=1 Tax=Bradyrhizobium canariense TaxID=255045 RepID=UPI00117810B2|nr:hypothetical protein [Bradyrhizobium canariense]
MKKQSSADDRNAQKQRRYRQRVAKHEVVADVVVGARVIDLVVRLNYLAQRDACKRKLIADAIARLLADAAQHLP